MNEKIYKKSLLVYELTDYGDLERYVAKKGDALSLAKEYSELKERLEGDSDEPDRPVFVTEILIEGPVTKDLICRLLNNEQFVSRKRTLAKFSNGKVVNEGSDNS